MHPEIEWNSGKTSLTGQKLHGPQAVIEELRPDVFATQHSDVKKVEINQGRVYIEMLFHAEGSGSGVKLVNNAWQVWTFEQGLVVRVQNFLDRDEARAAAGLEAKQAR